MTEPQSTATILWWLGMTAMSVVNVALWLRESRGLVRGGDGDPRRRQALLSAAFVFVCAFRSVLPRAEPLRTCLFDSWLSSAALGRAAATVAELSFVAQWALLLGRWARAAGTPIGAAVSRLLLPLIAVAELCSWYATLTTNALGSVIEESIWGLCGALVVLTLVDLRPRVSRAWRRFLDPSLVLASIYVLFMCTVDVPMYVARWRADERNGRSYLSLRDGWGDAAHRRIVTRRWEDWRKEAPWMSLYFGAGVWISLALIRAPLAEERS